MTEKLIVQVGNGIKKHYGYRYEVKEGIKATFLVCGAHSPRGLRVLGQLDLFHFIKNPTACENCLDRVMEELEKAVA
jgi:hypothetical protein